MSRTLTWLRPAWIIVFLISPILYALIYFIVRWRAKLTVGLCERHRRKRTQAIAIAWLTALAGIATVICSAVVPDQFAAFAAIGGFFIVIAGLIVGTNRSRVLVVNKIDKHFIWLSRVSPDYLSELADWNA